MLKKKAQRKIILQFNKRKSGGQQRNRSKEAGGLQYGGERGCVNSARLGQPGWAG